jgi:hypothetical protein
VAYQLTREELVQRLREQMGFLERSADSFDRGFEDEAKHLAVVIRVLLHDTVSSRSLLGQLGVKETLNFLDTVPPIIPANLVTTPGLVALSVGGGEAKYVALLGDRPRAPTAKPFAPWWNDPVTKDNLGVFFARRDYVLNIANKEGGAHVDPALDQSWANLTRDNTLGWVATTSSGPDAPFDSPALASIRQIAYELEQTLHGQLGHLLI